MATLLIVTACVFVALGTALSGFVLWLSCKICFVAQPARQPGGKPRGVCYGRALLCAIGLVVVGDAAAAALLYVLSSANPGAVAPTPSRFLPVGLACIGLLTAIEVLFLRFTLAASVGKSVLVTLTWNGMSALVGVGVFFGVRAVGFDALIQPTGSMAEAVLGDHKEVVCPSCGYRFPIDCSDQVDPMKAQHIWVSGCTCPNCRSHIQFTSSARPAAPSGDDAALPDPDPVLGDHLLVGERWFGPDLFPPQRLDLIVFHYPVDLSGPRPPPAPENYLKRVVGLPGETIAIHGGDLYVLAPDKGPQYDDLKNANDPAQQGLLWQKPHMHGDDPEALKRFADGAFQIVRKPPELILTMQENVYDNDHPAKDLHAARWAARDKDGAWKADDAHGFRLAAADDKAHWLGYRHLLRGEEDRPQLITDFMGYNTPDPDHMPSGVNWVGDLSLDVEVQPDQAQGELTLELSKGVDRFQARFDLATGQCTLVRVHDAGTKDEKEEELDRKPTNLKGGAKHVVRFADVDQRLTVWVDDALPFGDGVTYQPPKKDGKTVEGATENDLQPASVGVRGTAAAVRGLRLWRDTYYTTALDGNPANPDWMDAVPDDGTRVNPTDPTTWGKLSRLPTRTMYVQPGHYLCLGDNSSRSSDSRFWGLVPRRLLFGKPLLVYYPLDRAGWIH